MEGNYTENLKNKIVVVTGGGRGLGRIYAQSFARSMAITIICDMNADDMQQTVDSTRKEGFSMKAYQCDITDVDQVKSTFCSVREEYGEVDILVNNAGLTDPGGPLWETDIDKWIKLINVNIIGQYICIRNVIEDMKTKRDGTIINIASGAGVKAMPYMSAYVISKTAVIRLTEQISLEAGELGIKCFAVSPGVVNTEMTRNAYTSNGWKKWMPWLQKTIEEGNDVPPEKVADLILLLASGKFNSLSGCLINSSDDLYVLKERHKKADFDSFRKLRIFNG